MSVLTGAVRECSVPVVDIEDIVRDDVVGDVDIGPAIPIHIGNRDP
jgi:hypothetical protein